MVIGLALVADLGAPLRAALLASGALIVGFGTSGRVAGLSAGPEGLTISYAVPSAFVLGWDQIRELRPPRTPLGGWRILGSSSARTLMPSDLLGKEEFLCRIAGRAGLAFDGRTWGREHPEAPG